MSHHTPTRRRHVFSAYHFSSLGIFNGFVTSLPSLMQQPSECVCVASPRCFLPAWIIHHSPLIILFFFYFCFWTFPYSPSVSLILSVSLLSESLSSLSVSTLFLFIPSLSSSCCCISIRPDVVISLKHRKRAAQSCDGWQGASAWADVLKGRRFLLQVELTLPQAFLNCFLCVTEL